MKQALEQKLPQVSNRRLARALGVDRNRLSATRLNASLHRSKRRRAVDTGLTKRIRELIKVHPSFGYRRIWALLRFKEGILVNRKKVSPNDRSASCRSSAGNAPNASIPSVRA